MLRAIQEINPTYVVGENVRGLTNWNGGVVFEEVCADLENCGYEVQPILLAAASVGAPHRRDRVWFIATNTDLSRCEMQREQSKSISQDKRIEYISTQGIITNTERIRFQIGSETRNIRKQKEKAFEKRSESSIPIETNGGRFISNKWQNFPTQSPICSGDDGLPTELDGITFSKWRQESIKGYGNAIVPQVAYQIFKVIQELDGNTIPR
jgi:DNA (cytosine-5)-methyltransferase 1